MSGLGARIIKALDGRDLAAVEPQLVERLRSGVAKRRRPSIKSLKTLSAASDVGWLWIIDGLGLEDNEPPTVSQDVEFRISASLFGMKLGDRVPGPWIDPEETLRLNALERLALARVIQRNIGCSLVLGFEDGVKTLPDLVRHVALMLRCGRADDRWREILRAVEL